jgi:hypothetical protein
LLVPPQKRIRRDEGSKCFEALAPKRVGEGRKTAAFRVREPEPTATELGFEDTIFLKEIGDDLLLVPLQPASNHGDQDLKDHSTPQVGGSYIIAWPSIQQTQGISME